MSTRLNNSYVIFMNWIMLTGEDQLEHIKQLSETNTQVIFKHSTRCSISRMVKNQLEKSPLAHQDYFHYLDLIQYRNLSNKIADDFNVTHESPQILLIKNTHCIYHESHMAIDAKDILQHLSSYNQ